MRGSKAAIKPDGTVTNVPNPPSWLTKESKQEWRRVIRSLCARRILNPEDFGTLEAYCVAMGTARRMSETIERDGDFIETPQGLRRHPGVPTMFSALTEGRRLAAELGLTPASRNKAKASESADDLGMDL